MPECSTAPEPPVVTAADYVHHLHRDAFQVPHGLDLAVDQLDLEPAATHAVVRTAPVEFLVLRYRLHDLPRRADEKHPVYNVKKSFQCSSLSFIRPSFTISRYSALLYSFITATSVDRLTPLRFK